MGSVRAAGRDQGGLGTGEGDSREEMGQGEEGRYLIAGICRECVPGGACRDTRKELYSGDGWSSSPEFAQRVAAVVAVKNLQLSFGGGTSGSCGWIRQDPGDTWKLSGQISGLDQISFQESGRNRSEKAIAK